MPSTGSKTDDSALLASVGLQWLSGRGGAGAWGTRCRRDDRRSGPPISRSPLFLKTFSKNWRQGSTEIASDSLFLDTVYYVAVCVFATLVYLIQFIVHLAFIYRRHLFFTQLTLCTEYRIIFASRTCGVRRHAGRSACCVCGSRSPCSRERPAPGGRRQTGPAAGSTPGGCRVALRAWK